MVNSPAKLVDARGQVLATVSVVREGDHFGGTIDLRDMPDSLRTLFVEFEEIVTGQMFSFLDEIQHKIAAHGIKAVFDNGQESLLNDLQVFPSTGDVSFKLVRAPDAGVTPNGALGTR